MWQNFSKMLNKNNKYKKNTKHILFILSTLVLILINLFRMEQRTAECIF